MKLLCDFFFIFNLLELSCLVNRGLYKFGESPNENLNYKRVRLMSAETWLCSVHSHN